MIIININLLKDLKNPSNPTPNYSFVPRFARQGASSMVRESVLVGKPNSHQTGKTHETRDSNTVRSDGHD